MHRQGMMTMMMMGHSTKRRFGTRWFHPAGFAAWCCAAAIGFTVCLPCRADITTTGSIYDVSGSYRVGYTADGSLLIDYGSQLSRTSGYIGYNSGSSGTATVSGTGSMWTSASSLYVGRDGTGSLTVQDGGQVSSSSSYLGYNSGSSGTATVSGTGSKWTSTSSLDVGYSGTGSLTVQNGGQVSSSSLSYIGYNSSSSGTAVVSGAGSRWTSTSGLYVGNYGTGSLTVQDGGHVSSTDTSLGESSGSSGTAVVSGVGSSWASTGALYVGRSGTGSLTIQNGGYVSNSYAYSYLGSYEGSSGTAVVSGTGSRWTSSGRLYVGNLGTGSLTVQDGGHVSAEELYASLRDVHGNGIITAGGGVLDVAWVFDAANGLAQTFAFGSGGSLNISFSSTRVLGAGYKTAGSLRIADGRSITSSDGYLGYHSGSSGTAVVSGSGSTWTCTGNLRVGWNGTGSLTVQDGGQVSSNVSYIGGSGSGTAVVSGAGSRWTSTRELWVGQNGTGSLTVEDSGQVSAGELYTSLTDLHGNGIINAGGGVLDADMVFDAAHGLSQTYVFGSGGSLNVSFSSTRVLGAGYKTAGNLRIADGHNITSSGGYLGHQSGSVGAAVVSGTGSRWTSTGSLDVGYYGTGWLTVQDPARSATPPATSGTPPALAVRPW